MDSASEWGALRITLLFAAAAVALALIAAPLLESRSGFLARNAGVDLMSTGSISGTSYTIRRSVLQSSPDAICIIRSDGARSGDC